MSEFEDKIEAIGEDGVKYYLPKQSVAVHRPDHKARVLAIGAIVVAGGAVVYEAVKAVVKPVQPPKDNSGLVSTVEAMQTQQYLNAQGDLFNENALRALYGVDPVSGEGFWEEREIWAEKAKATPVPTSPATPVKGG